MGDKKAWPKRLRWLVIGTALTIAFIAGANAIVVTQLHRSTLSETQTDLLRQSLTLSELTERNIQTVDLVVSAIAHDARHSYAMNGNLNCLTGEDYRNFLKEKKAALPQVSGLGIIGADGNRIAQTRDEPVPSPDVSQREYFRVLKENPGIKVLIGEPVEGRMTGAWLIMLSRPIVTEEGKFIGVVFASMQVKYFEGLFQATSLGDGYAAALMRRDGTLLTRYPVSSTVGARLTPPILNALSNARSGVSRATSPVDGEARIAAAYAFLNYPLVVVVSQSEAAAFAGWRTAVIAICLAAGTKIGIILFGAWLIARSWKQQERLNAARDEIVESVQVRALAEAELNRQRDLAEQSKRFTAAVENMSQGLCMFDKNARLVVCNTLYTRMYRLPPELATPGSRHSDIIAHRVRNGILKGGDGSAAVQLQLSALSALPMERPSSRIDEHTDGKLIRVTRQPLPGGGWVATHDDITEQRRAERELDDTKQFLHSIIENIPIAVVVKDVNTRRYVLLNRAFQATLGLDCDQLLGKTVYDLYNQKTAAFIDNTDNEFLRDGCGTEYKEYDVETRTDGQRIHATRRIAIRDAKGEPKYLVVVIEDVTERKRSEKRIAFMAHHDALTGLANRAAVTQRIEEAAARQRRWGDPFTVLLLDLDRFKHVNDTLGHSAGDALLREAAVRLKALLKETDVLARLGGDEFAIIQSCESTSARPPARSRTASSRSSAAPSISNATRSISAPASASRSRPSTAPIRTAC